MLASGCAYAPGDKQVRAILWATPWNLFLVFYKAGWQLDEKEALSNTYLAPRFHAGPALIRPR